MISANIMFCIIPFWLLLICCCEQATDADSPPNNVILFNLTKNPNASLFEIGSSSGVLKLIGRLNYETEKSYTLEAVAYNDGAGNLVSTTATVAITVTVRKHAHLVMTLAAVPFFGCVYQFQ